MPHTLPETDQLDRDIALLLARDARTSFRQIASHVGVTEGTVRARVRRLQASGLLRLEPIVDIGVDSEDGVPATSRHMVIYTLRCLPGSIDRVRDAVLAIPRIEALYDANAAHRLVAIALVDSLAELASTTDRVLALDGLREAESEVVLQTIKYDPTIGPIATAENQPAASPDPA